MCKLFILTKTDKLTETQLSNLINAIHNPLTETENQGFGWALWGEKGLFGEKFVNPDDFFLSRADFGPIAEVVTSKLEMNSFGVASKPVGALLVHGRTSTNEVSLANTHPLINNDWALVHNGVVYNTGKEIKRKTTNDTEFILEHYTQGGIEQVVESIEGYYACGMINTKTGNLAVFRDATARLYVSWIKELEAYAFATTEEILITALESLDLMDSPIRHANTNFHLVFKPNGETVLWDSFEPKLRSFGALDKKSLGSSVKDFSNFDMDIPKYRDDYPSEWRNVRTGEVIEDDEFELMHIDEQMGYEPVYSKAS